MAFTVWASPRLDGSLSSFPCHPLQSVESVVKNAAITISTLLFRTTCLAAVCPTLMAATLYVAPTGNDHNPGTKDKPLASLPAARDAARAAGDSGQVILLAPGRYFHASKLTFDERDSGLTVKGANAGATAELHGGLPVTGWEKW